MAATLGLHERAWDMTLADLNLAAEAYADRRREDMRTIAWHAASVINVWIPRGKRRVRVSDLMPSERRTSFAVMPGAAKAIAEHMREVQRELDRGRN